MDDARFTDPRVPDLGVRGLFVLHRRWQAWLEVEAALALTEAELGLIPPQAGLAIARTARLELLDRDRITEGIARTSHPLVALIAELSRVVGPPHDAWVHWGATTQNITQSGDILLIRFAHDAFLAELADILDAMADLADRSASVLTAGRTHGQHAVPITFGFKAAAWLDELIRHAQRLQQAQPRLFVAMMGGAVGTFASFGKDGPAVQTGVADRLQLLPSPLPSRNTLDHLAEYVCVLAMMAATCGRIGHEVATLMKPEFGEVAEPMPASTVGSSTMPHKQNPQLSNDLSAISAGIRALVPLALEGLLGEHEADSAAESMMFDAVSRACVLTGDLLPRLHLIITGLKLDEHRMRANTDLTAGALMSEAVMLGLGAHTGRQVAHTIVAEAARTAAATGTRFGTILAADPRVAAHLDPDEIGRLVDPDRYTGSSAEIALSTAGRARTTAAAIRTTIAQE